MAVKESIMTGLDNQKEIGSGYFSITEQGLRHLAAAVMLIAVTLFSTQFFSVYFLYAIVSAVVVAMVAAFLIDVHHQKMSVDEDDV